jgi:hypothetical protein
MLTVTDFTRADTNLQTTENRKFKVVKIWYKSARKVVLHRDLSLEQAQTIAKNAPLNSRWTLYYTRH